jgi:hypothetical protein
MRVKKKPINKDCNSRCITHNNTMSHKQERQQKITWATEAGEASSTKPSNQNEKEKKKLKLP